MGEHRAFGELEGLMACAVHNQLSADDVGRHEVGRALDALERKPQGIGE
jgi:hypothetical protein